MQKKWTSFLITVALLFGMFFFVTIKLGEGYSPKSQSSPFDSSAFFSSLQSITGQLFIGPHPDVFNTYAAFFSGTEKFLSLENYEITHQVFKDSFQQLSEHGIPIRIILENQIYNAYQNFFKQLQTSFSGNQNVHIQSDEPMNITYQHSKVMLNEKAFRIQTANLTKSSFESNREHFFFSSHSGVRESLQQLFERDWKGVPLSPEQLHPNLVVCPLNCRAVIEAMLSGAEESIIIQTQYILDPAILALLRHKSVKVDLRIIVADTLDNTEVVNYFGPAVARKLTSHYNHTKMILVDRKYLLLGSMNLSDNSLDNNREIGIILLDPTVIQHFEDGFWIDWKANRKSLE